MEECLHVLSKPPQEATSSSVTCVDENSSYWTESSLVSALGQFGDSDATKVIVSKCVYSIFNLLTPFPVLGARANEFSVH